VSPRTLTAPVTNRGYWRRVLRLCHPDSGAGDHDLFIWISHVRMYVMGDDVEEMPQEARREPPRHHASPSGASQAERIPYDKSESCSELTARALALAETAGEPYAGVLRLLEDCVEAPPFETALYRQQQMGASYRQLARIAHESGMSYSERIAWYCVCEGVPLAMRHAAHILSRL
jgi:hypothetical protein